MAFGIASGVTPQAGIYTAVVAGFLISALGGSRLQIGGPTGAFVVKPIVTGRGIYFTAVPKPVTAISMRITPASKVTISRPETPCVAMIAATITTNAQVEPPI